MEVPARGQRPYGEPQPSLGAECLCLVFLGLSICLCSCGLSTRLMAERLQKRPAGGLPPPSHTITGSLEMGGTFVRDKRNFSGVTGMRKEPSRSSKQLCPFQCKVRIHTDVGNLCELSTVKKAARAPKVLIHHKSGTLLNLFIDLTLSK